MGILTQHMYKAPAPIRALQSGAHCPPGLEAIILRMWKKDSRGSVPKHDGTRSGHRLRDAR